jgi:SAM-dependent methyltransferase
MGGPGSALNWRRWLDRWDAQQPGYIPEREARFLAMFDVLEVMLPPEFLAVDLGCGPGSLARRLLDRFPDVRCCAVDLDPVLLAMGQAVHGTIGGRLTWVDADLREADWAGQFGTPRVDAVLSTTALHWLPSDVLARLYRQVGGLVREGGVFLDGDTIRFGPALPSFRRLGVALEQRIRERAHTHQGVEDWEGWWAALVAEPAAAELFAERRRRFAWRNLEPGKRSRRSRAMGSRAPSSTFMKRRCATPASARSASSGSEWRTGCCWPYASAAWLSAGGAAGV